MGAAYATWSQDLTIRSTVTTGTWFVSGGTLHPSKDSYINENATTTNYGIATTLLEGKVTGKQEKALIKFDLPPRLSGKTIDTATLRLYCTNNGNNQDTINIYRLLKSWVEGNNTLGSGVTWATTDGSTSWGSDGASTAGTDFNSNSIAHVAVPGGSSARNNWYTLDMTTEVQAYVNTVNPVTNNGWIFNGGFGGNETTTFASNQDNSTPTAHPPELVITFH